uniref:Ubiquinone biosynthesis protein COQ4 homolog, mitochondrial n=1 Tax=Anopheles christyi TaxID=43041 RepID=A0A182JZX4_9DIPT
MMIAYLSKMRSASEMAGGETTQFLKLSSAVFYGLSSFLITVVNKTVLTSYRFPSFLVLSLGQLTASILVLFVAKRLQLVKFPDFSRDIARRIFPLPLIYLGNMMFGLGGTQALSLPMFAALRRFSILLTMLLELLVLGIRPTLAVKVSVFAMVGGALMAALDDLSFNLQGYMYVMITNTLTAANGVYMKKKLDTADMGKYGLMYYNSLFMILPAFVGTWLAGDIERAWQYEGWDDPFFAAQFLLSCVMGFILSYSVILCTQHNSALTTTIVGCLKNISVTYIGMFIGGDYVFSWLNALGINISVAGSLLYTYVTFRKKPNSGGGTGGSGDSTSPDKKLLLPTAGRIDNVHDMIACLGETTGREALEKILHNMRATEEGQQILAEKPRINTRTVDMEALKMLPENTFGYTYVKFMEDNNITPDSRMEVRFLDEPELAYVMTRYRETHDMVHAILDMPTNMLGEVTVKWVEALNTGLPMCYGGAVFGAFRLRPKQRQNYLRKYLPWALRTGNRIKPLMGVYWEKRWEQDVTELRKELNIELMHS